MCFSVNMGSDAEIDLKLACADTTSASEIKTEFDKVLGEMKKDFGDYRDSLNGTQRMINIGVNNRMLGRVDEMLKSAQVIQSGASSSVYVKVPGEIVSDLKEMLSGFGPAFMGNPFQ